MCKVLVVFVVWFCFDFCVFFHVAAVCFPILGGVTLFAISGELSNDRRTAEGIKFGFSDSDLTFEDDHDKK